VLRCEIKNITPPKDVLGAMEKQMRAEREKRAVMLTSEGARDAAVNTAEGQKHSHQAVGGQEPKQIKEAEGAAEAILAIASATAEGIRRVAEPPGSLAATRPSISAWPSNTIQRFDGLANASDTTTFARPVKHRNVIVTISGFPRRCRQPK
jgi:regulator of protease activity HflC (stomatin/prohibitin superfamily)